VQTVAQLDGGTGVKLTIAQYLTPKGRRIQGVGIMPDITLDDLDSAGVDRAKRPDRFIRERDLRNHLTATVESAEEKKAREEWERQDRQKRAEAIEKRSKAKRSEVKDDEEMFRITKPADDYQVQQAAALLKASRFTAPAMKN
jgi:carboxyl-terminal processing protease